MVVASVEDPTDYTVLAERFVATYEGTEEYTAQDLVDLHTRVTEYRADHPDKGSQAVATALGVPRSTIRRWVDDGARPHVVRGLDAAEDRRWLDLSWGGDRLAALTDLVAWVFSSGSIDADRYAPYFIVDDDAASERLATAVRELGLALNEVDRSRDPRDERAIQGEMVTVSSDQAVLGRLLAVLGAPVGTKRDRGDLSLPPYLQHEDCPGTLRRQWLRTYVRNRARDVATDAGASWAESRSDAYLDAFVAFARAVTGEAVNRHGDIDIRFSKAAVAALGLSRATLSGADAAAPRLPTVPDPTNRDAFARALAQTYGDGAWERVQQYERVRAYAREHPDASAADISDALDIDYNPAYQWTQQDTTPDPARAIATAEQQGWLPFEYGESPTPALVALTGWTISRGRVHPSRYEVRLAAAPDAYDEADGLIRAVGLEPGREEPTDDAPPYVRPKQGTLLGRVLAALGVPTDGSAAVPEWVWQAPRASQLTFVRGVLYPRGEWEDGAQHRLTLPVELGRAVESLLDRTLGTAAVEYRDGMLVLGQAAAVQAARPPLQSSP